MYDLTKLCTESPPKDRQFLAWGSDLLTDKPAWFVVQFNPTVGTWEWSGFGKTATIDILGWLELPWNDYIGNAILMSGIIPPLYNSSVAASVTKTGQRIVREMATKFPDFMEQDSKPKPRADVYWFGAIGAVAFLVGALSESFIK